MRKLLPQKEAELDPSNTFSYELQEEAAELEEILAKRQKRGKQVDDKPLEEKTVLHSKDNVIVLI